MNIQLSTEAWAALGCLAGVVLLSGAILWGAWRRGMRSQARTPPADKVEVPSFNRTWQKEDAQFAELTRVADDLRAHHQEQPGEKNQPG